MLPISKLNLTAYYIELDLETKEVYAEGILDSTETLVQKPIFKDGNEEFESKTLRYNFETEKGIITDVVTEQGEGFVHSQPDKKNIERCFYFERRKIYNLRARTSAFLSAFVESKSNFE